MEKATLLARENNIIVNSDLKRPGVHSDRAIVIKEISIDMPKEMIIAVVSEFGQVVSIRLQLIELWQKTVVEFAESSQADQLAAKWLFLIGKDSVHVAKAVRDRETWASRDWYRALLFTLSVGTIAHDLGNLLAGAGGKTCVINRSLVTGNRVHCAVVCFENDKVLEFAFCTESIFGGVRLSWTRLDMVWCDQCEKLGHSVLECNAETSTSPTLSKSFKRVVSKENRLQLAKLYVKKSVPIFKLAVVSLASLSNGSHSGSGPGFGSSSDASGVVGHLSPTGPVNSFLEARLTFLEHSLELLMDKVSGIIDKLDSSNLVPLAFASSSQPLVVPGLVNMKFGLDMVLDEPESAVLPPSSVSSGVSSLDSSSSKILTLKVGCLESKLMALKALVCLVLKKLDQMCAGSSSVVFSGMNNSAKQKNIICWHKDINNLVSILTETKLKDKVRPWIANKFDGVQIFVSGLDSGYLGSGVAIIMDIILVKHVCKVFEISGHLLSVKLLFKNKLSVSILGLYAGASVSAHFLQADEINSLIAKAVNESSFVILGSNFNKDGSHRCASFRKCFDLGLVNALGGSLFGKNATWTNFRGVTKIIDYMFVSLSLVNAILDCSVTRVDEYFDTDHRAVTVSVGLGGFLDTAFKDFSAVTMAMFKCEFDAALLFLDLDAIVRKLYCSFKLSESKHAEEFHIRLAVSRRMESFKIDKSHTIRSVLECSFYKVVLDYLVVDDELVLDLGLVKSKVNVIMEGWTRKRKLVTDISADWCHQYQPLEYVFDDAFSRIMDSIGSVELLGVVSDLLNDKAAGLSGISNELWKHCDKSVLNMLLVLLNSCLLHKISLACSIHNIFHEDNFSGLKGITTQFPIFAVGSVVEDALEKNLMTDFGLIDGYQVHDDLDQGEVFSPLLWHIFYDSFLCEVKRQEEFCGYRLNSHFVAKTGRVELQAGFSSFFAADAFMDNTIWVGSSQTATQHILNIASKFFRINNISINNDKTVAIPINYRVVNSFLTISDAPISIAKKKESYCYKMQFSFVPLSVCCKWDALIRKDFKSKVWFVFLPIAVYLLVVLAPMHSDSPTALPCLWFLGSAFDWKTFKHWKRLDPRGPIPDWFNVSVGYLGSVESSFSVHDCSVDVSFAPNVLKSTNFDLVCNRLLGLGADSLLVYTDRSLVGLSTLSVKSGAAVFFDDINMSLGVRVLGLLSSTLAELQAIAFALECVPVVSKVCLFLDSQAALNVCRSELGLVHLDFQNSCWVECHHIANLVHAKRLDVSWCKVKGHSGVVDNDQANKLAGHAALFDFVLLLRLNEWFILAGGSPVLGNSRHFVHDIYQSIHHLHWGFGSGTRVVTGNLLTNIN
ncbi:hypothetical protein G9A89_003760 [Geosiphon pyriformis]|nr:hypothetical protein G9A89_003760 [Geosiphon pyriformis]